jgi:arsenite methyltransferase
MAELNAAEATVGACCAPEQQASCCEPSEKAGCCPPDSSRCGCPAGQADDDVDVREQVRLRYAAAARGAGAEETAGSCTAGLTDEQGREVFGGSLYREHDVGDAQGVLTASLGCGVPTAVADLHEGEIVLDLGSGAGADVLRSFAHISPPDSWRAGRVSR